VPSRSTLPKGDGGGLALLAAFEVVAELLALVEIADPDRSTAEMWTNTSFRPVIGLDEPIALCCVEPLYGSGSHSK